MTASQADSQERLIRRLAASKPFVVFYFVLSGAATVFGLIFSGEVQVDEGLARANYAERTTAVAVVSTIAKEPPSIITTDGVAVGFSPEACSPEPNLSAGDPVVVATMPSVSGSVQLSVVGPCDPIELARSVRGGDSWWNAASRPYMDPVPLSTIGTWSWGIGYALLALGLWYCIFRSLKPVPRRASDRSRSSS